jgi:hypothetical protein
MRWKRHEPAPGATDGWVAAAWILAQAVFLFILPLTGEPRALVPALAPLALLMAHALGWWRDGGGHKLAPGLPLLVAGLVVMNGGEVVLGRVHGYREAARAIPAPPEGVLILMGSDPAGEGAFIVERLMGDERRAGVVLRAGQWLAESNWMGTRHKLVYENAGQVRQAIQALPVRYVVIDTSAESWPGQSLLREAVAGNPGEFRLTGRFPVSESPGGAGRGAADLREPGGGDAASRACAGPLGDGPERAGIGIPLAHGPEIASRGFDFDLRSFPYERPELTSGQWGVSKRRLFLPACVPPPPGWPDRADFLGFHPTASSPHLPALDSPARIA